MMRLMTPTGHVRAVWYAACACCVAKVTLTDRVSHAVQMPLAAYVSHAVQVTHTAHTAHAAMWDVEV